LGNHAFHAPHFPACPGEDGRHRRNTPGKSKSIFSLVLLPGYRDVAPIQRSEKFIFSEKPAFADTIEDIAKWWVTERMS
jgi:hypothetical protein